MTSTRVIIDTDPGVDDVLAILFALASPELDVVAITITFGNTLAPTAHSNLLKIYYALQNEFKVNDEAKARFRGLRRENGNKVILAQGAEGPIGGERDLAAYFHGKDGLSNISSTHPQLTPPVILTGESHADLDLSEKPAYQVILDTLKREDKGTVKIVALGPLTNVALALKADPTTFSRVGEVVWMGGALDVPGNTSPVAEFNCFADPYAMQDLLNAVESDLFKFTICPLDITTPHTISFNHLIKEAPLSPLREFTSAMLIRVRGLMASFGLTDEMEMHDPVAIWCALAFREGESGWESVRRRFMVERTGELTRGMCVVDRRGTGDESFLRTESSISSGENDKTGADRQETKIKGAPWVLTKTPGSKVLEELLLARVFGKEN